MKIKLSKDTHCFKRVVNKYTTTYKAVRIVQFVNGPTKTYKCFVKAIDGRIAIAKGDQHTIRIIKSKERLKAKISAKDIGSYFAKYKIPKSLRSKERLHDEGIIIKRLVKAGVSIDFIINHYMVIYFGIVLIKKLIKFLENPKKLEKHLLKGDSWVMLDCFRMAKQLTVVPKFKGCFNKWHEDLNREIDRIKFSGEISYTNLIISMIDSINSELPSNIRIVLPQDKKDICEWGIMNEHCIASYIRLISDTEIFPAVYINDVMTYNIHAKVFNKTIKILQIRGHANRDPEEWVIEQLAKHFVISQ